jgi:hypothetical protein
VGCWRSLTSGAKVLRLSRNRHAPGEISTARAASHISRRAFAPTIRLRSSCRSALHRYGRLEVSSRSGGDCSVPTSNHGSAARIPRCIQSP